MLFDCEQVASKLDPAEKEKLEKEIEDAIQWLDNNQLAEVGNQAMLCKLQSPATCCIQRRQLALLSHGMVLLSSRDCAWVQNSPAA